jgi:hypothetical protein
MLRYSQRVGGVRLGWIPYVNHQPYYLHVWV